MVVLKIKFGEDTRRVTLAEASFPKLNELLHQIFPYNNEGFTTKYQDEDGDTLTISSSPELQEAFKFAEKAEQNGVLRLIVSVSSEQPKSTTTQDTNKNAETPKAAQEKKEPTSIPFGLSSLMGMLGNSALAPFIPQIIGNPVLSSMLVQLMSNEMIRSNVLALLSNPTVSTMVAQFAPQFLANPELLASILPLLSVYASQPNANQASSTPGCGANSNFGSLFNNFFVPPAATQSTQPPQAPQVSTPQASQTTQAAQPQVDLNAFLNQMGQMYGQFADQFSSAFIKTNTQTKKKEEPAPAQTPASTPAPAPVSPVVEVPVAETKPIIVEESKEEIKPVEYVSIFMDDVTVPDGTVVAPDQLFPKIWKIKNAGTTAWPESTVLGFQTGDRLSAQDSIPVPSVLPGETADITVVMKAPSKSGRYISFWGLHDGEKSFGHRVWADITVFEPRSVSTPPAPSPSPLPSAPMMDEIPSVIKTEPQPQQPVLSQSVRQLIDMGFDKDPVLLQQALDRQNGDLSLAIQDLLGL